MKNCKSKIYQGVNEYLLFDSEKQVRTRIELAPDLAKIFAGHNKITAISPMDAKAQGMFSYKETKLTGFKL